MNGTQSPINVPEKEDSETYQLFKKNQTWYWIFQGVFLILNLSLFILYLYTHPSQLWILITIGIFMCLLWGFVLFLQSRKVHQLRKQSIEMRRRYCYRQAQIHSTTKGAPQVYPRELPKMYSWNILGRIVIVLLLCLWGIIIFTYRYSASNTRCFKQVSDYFQSIRTNEAALTSFFSQMPKGGDLHHHLSGSIYAESFWLYAVNNKWWIGIENGVPSISEKKTTKNNIRLDRLQKPNQYNRYKQMILREWSVKDHYPAYNPGDLHFFESFEKFGKAKDSSFLWKWLVEIKKRAAIENVQYVETMLNKLKPVINSSAIKQIKQLFNNDKKPVDTEIIAQLPEAYKLLKQAGIENATKLYIDNQLMIAHNASVKDSPEFLMRYLAIADRTESPAQFFIDLVTAFESTTHPGRLIVGINILNREDNDIAVRDYNLHMAMIQYLRKIYNSTNISLHAGELTLGLVEPEQLGWHIKEAITKGGAKRIGHGTDIGYDPNCRSTLERMKDSSIAIEINLWSNEFILNVKNDQHPISLYFRAGVPIVLGTDDAGVLRSNLTRQFVLLALRYPEISYTDIQNIIRNSIRYSFIYDRQVKEKMITELDERLKLFEKNILPPDAASAG